MPFCCSLKCRAQRSNVSKTEEEEETEAPLNSRMQDVRVSPATPPNQLIWPMPPLF